VQPNLDYESLNLITVEQSCLILNSGIILVKISRLHNHPTTYTCAYTKTHFDMILKAVLLVLVSQSGICDNTEHKVFWHEYIAVLAHALQF